MLVYVRDGVSEEFFLRDAFFVSAFYVLVDSVLVDFKLVATNGGEHFFEGLLRGVEESEGNTEAMVVDDHVRAIGG